MASLFDGISADAGNFSSKNGARLSLSVDALSKAGKVESRLVFYDTNTGGIREHVTVDWKVVSITHLKKGGRLQTFALGEDGQVVAIEKEKVWRRDIPRATFEKPRFGAMRKIRSVGEVIVAVGMNRQAYVLEQSGAWSDASAPRTDADPVTGFEAVVGVGVEDFVCAGWDGEIWRRRLGKWESLNSPTNVLITDLAIGANKIYGCGLAGLVVQGDSSSWEVLDQKPFDMDLYSVGFALGRLFVSSLGGVYELKDQKLFHVDYGVKPPETAHTLCVVDEGMAVIGAKDLLFMSEQGWRRLE